MNGWRIGVPAAMLLLACTGCGAAGREEEAPPFLELSTKSVTFEADDDSQIVEVLNSGGGMLSFSVTISATSGGVSWLKAQPDAGSLAGGAGKAVLLTIVNRASLQPGTYTGQVSVEAENLGGESVLVTMTVGQPTLQTDPADTVDFGTDDDSRVLSVTNSGDGVLLYALTLPGQWLSTASPLQKQLAPGQTDTIVLQLDRSTVPWYGEGSAQLVVTSNGLNDAEHSATVELDVRAVIDAGCVNDSDCEVEGYYCEDSSGDGACVLKRTAGQECDFDKQCASGHCADWVCCSSLCDDPCRSCSQNDTKGSCEPVPDGTECEDGLLCTTEDACSDGDCLGGPAPDCSHLDSPCGEGSCDPVSGECVPPAEDDKCIIGEECLDSGAWHPNHNCLRCLPSLAKDDWSVVEDACLVNDQCYSGGDEIDGACKVCDPEKPTEASAVVDGSECEPDENACTADICQAGECTHEPLTGESCNDGDPCTKADSCDSGNCSGMPYSCDDGLPCTEDVCDGGGGCSHPVVAGHCLVDGVCRNDGETAPDSGGCLLCDPGEFQEDWTAQPDGLLCNDSNGCTVTDLCGGGICAGTPKDCSDGFECTTDSCVNGECAHEIDSGYCLVDEVCYEDGALAEGTLCLACLADVAQDQWSPSNESMPCDDGAFCSIEEKCVAGECVGVNNDCGGDDCNKAWCIEPQDECVTSPVENGTACDDGNACTLDDSCTAGACGGTEKSCDGEVELTPCTEAVCDPAGEPAPGTCFAVLKKTGAPCEDGLACTDGTTCSGTGVCGGGETVGSEECALLLGVEGQCVAAACQEPDGCVLEPIEQGVACELPNATAQCDGNGACVLIDCSEDVYADCNEEPVDGCEIELWQDLMNCGGCDKKCTYDQAWTACAGGECTFVSCHDGYKDCNASMDDGCEACVDTDPVNCGECDELCDTTNPSKVGVCEEGQCELVFCDADTFNLDGNPANGCECTVGGSEQCNGIDDNCNGLVDEGFDLMTDMENCGGCGVVCDLPNTVAADCVNGTCVIIECPPDLYDRNGLTDDGCEHAMLWNGELWVDAINGGGPDADGTQAHPFADLQEGVNAAVASNLIHVLEGVYMGGILVDKVGLVIIADGPGLPPIIAVPEHGTGITVTADDVSIVGLVFEGGAVGIHFQGTADQFLQGGMMADVEVCDLHGESVPGGHVAGIFAEYAESISLSLSFIHDLVGGDMPDEGAGSLAAGARFLHSDGGVVAGCRFERITGGPAGIMISWICGASKSCGYQASGGLGTAILGEQSHALTVIASAGLDIVGGIGAEKASNNFVGGVGGVGAGIHLSSCSGAVMTANAFGNIDGGQGGQDKPNLKQVGFGIYLDDGSLDAQVSMDNTLDDAPVVFLSGAQNVEVTGLSLTQQNQPTNLGKLVVLNSNSITIAGNQVGGYEGERGASGHAPKSSDCIVSDGLPGRGIYVRSCEGCTVAGNTVSAVVSGRGGHRWKSFQCHTSGNGGPTAGIEIVDSTDTVVEGNTVSAVTGNAGGGGNFGEGGDASAFRVSGSSLAGCANNMAFDVTGETSSDNPPGDSACLRLDADGNAYVDNLTCHSIGDEVSPGYGVLLDENQLNSVTVRSSIFSTISRFGARGLAGVPGMLSVYYSAFHECGEGPAEDATLVSALEADPLFVLPDQGSFHLQPGSPCIDAGNPSTECNNEPVPNGCRVNMGAYGDTADATSAPGADHCSPCP